MQEDGTAETLLLDELEAWIRAQPPTGSIGIPHNGCRCPVANALRQRYPEDYLVTAQMSGGYYYTPAPGLQCVHVPYGPGVGLFVNLVDCKKRPISRRTALKLLKTVREAFALL